MNIGARVIKTGIAVLLSSFIVQYLFDAPILVAALAATIAIKPSLVHAFKYLKEIIIGNLLGAVTALSLYYLFGVSPIVIALTVISCITLTVKLGYKDTVHLTILTALVILGGSLDSDGNLSLVVAAERLSQLLIGVLSAFVVNVTVFPPKNEERLFNELKALSKELKMLLKVATSKSKSFTSYKKEIEKITTDFNKVKLSLELVEADLKRPFLKERYKYMKKILLYRQYVKILGKQIEVFKSLETRFSNLDNISDEQLIVLQGYLDYILLELDLSLLAQEKRVRQNRFFDLNSHAESLQLNFEFNVQTLLDDLDKKNEDFWWRVFPIITSCVDLKSDISKLNKIYRRIYSNH